jgi:hypothetical protein
MLEELGVLLLQLRQPEIVLEVGRVLQEVHELGATLIGRENMLVFRGARPTEQDVLLLEQELLLIVFDAVGDEEEKGNG